MTHVKVFLLALCLVLQACTGTKIKGPEPSWEPLSFQESSEILQQADTGAVTLRRLFRATFSDEEGKYTLRLAYVYASPDKVRLELLPLNASLSLKLITSMQGDAVYIDWPEKFAATGKLSDLLELSFLGSALSEEQIFSVLGTRLTKNALPEGVKIFQVNGGYVFAAPQAYYETDQSFVLREFEIGNESGERLLRGNVLGDGIHLELVEGEQKLWLQLVKEKRNREIPNKLFQPSVPRSFTTRSVS